MRSCFVPNCDFQCKKNMKRMMFKPPKNEELFNVWKAVLPNRRELRPTDRVCERHFSPNNIVKTFDHIINGVLHQIDRGKPKLLATAVPCFNLPTDDCIRLPVKHEVNESNKKTKKQHGNVKETLPIETNRSPKTRRPIIKRLARDSNKKRREHNDIVRNQNYNETTESVNVDLFDEPAADDRIDEDSNVEIQDSTYEQQDDTVINCGERTVNLQIDTSLFDGMYEDIYEVTLPNTLWGIHRDPNRTFIVFSYFDAKTCAMSKLIHLDSDMNTHIYVRGKLVNKSLSNLSIEYLTNLVSEVDEYQICERFDLNGECHVVAVEHNLCAACQSIKVR